MSTAHIDQMMGARAAVFPGNCRAGPRRIARHRLVEDGRGFRMLLEIVEVPHAVAMLEGRLAGLHAVEQLPPGLPEGWVEEMENRWTQAGGNVRPNSGF